MKKYLMLATALMWSVPAHSRDVAQDDGNELIELCTSQYDFSQGMCLGYVRGLSAAVDVLMAMNNKEICYPANATVGQMRDVVISYIRRNPASRHEGNVLLFIRAMGEAWPCK